LPSHYLMTAPHASVLRNAVQVAYTPFNYQRSLLGSCEFYQRGLEFSGTYNDP